MYIFVLRFAAYEELQFSFRSRFQQISAAVSSDIQFNSAYTTATMHSYKHKINISHLCERCLVVYLTNLNKL